jgi:hypothetical protein
MTIKTQRGTIKRSFNIIAAYAESFDQNEPFVNWRLRKLTKYFGDFEIIQQEIENAATSNKKAEQEYRQRELLNEKYFFIEAALKKKCNMHTYYSAMCTGTHSISHYFNMNS